MNDLDTQIQAIDFHFKEMERYAKLIEVPLKEWPGNCFAIASMLVEKKVLVGKAVYGHWLGYISPDCELFAGRPFTHHGWIMDGETIKDPTRWYFEDSIPYLWIGPADDKDYDLGGNQIRKAFMRSAPPWVESQSQFEVPKHLVPFTQMILDDTWHEPLCAQQVMWLASLPLDTLADQAEPLFKWVSEGIDLAGFIPMDNRLAVLGK